MEKREKSNAEILKEKQAKLLDLMNPNNSYAKNEAEMLQLQCEIDDLLPKVEQNNVRRLPDGGEEMLSAEEEAHYDRMSDALENDEHNVDNSGWQGSCQEMGF